VAASRINIKAGFFGSVTDSSGSPPAAPLVNVYVKNPSRLAGITGASFYGISYPGTAPNAPKGIDIYFADPAPADVPGQVSTFDQSGTQDGHVFQWQSGGAATINPDDLGGQAQSIVGDIELQLDSQFPPPETQ
jgi:hypothetical protein